MLDDPIQQSFFKTDIVSRLLAFDPFVAQDLFPLCEEFLVEQRFFDDVRSGVGTGAHGESVDSLQIRENRQLPNMTKYFGKRFFFESGFTEFS